MEYRASEGTRPGNSGLQHTEIMVSFSCISALHKRLINIGRPENGKRKCYFYPSHHFYHYPVFSVSVKNSKKQDRLEIFLTL